MFKHISAHNLLFCSWPYTLRSSQRTPSSPETACDFSSLQVMCFMITAFLHLFFMAAFSWMLVEGLLLWSKVVAVNMSEDKRMKFYYVTGWGIYRLLCITCSEKCVNFLSSKSFSRIDSQMFDLIQYESCVPLLWRGCIFMCQSANIRIYKLKTFLLFF